MNTEKWIIPKGFHIIPLIIERYEVEENVAFEITQKAMAQIILDSSSKYVTIADNIIWIKWNLIPLGDIMTVTKSSQGNFLLNHLEYQGAKITCHLPLGDIIHKIIIVDIE